MTTRPIHRFGVQALRLHGLDATSTHGLAFYGLAHDPDAAQAVRDASQLGPAFPPGADRGDAAGADLGALCAGLVASGTLPVQVGGTQREAMAFAAGAGPAWLVLIAPGLVEPGLVEPPGAGGLLAIGTNDLLPARLHAAWLDAGGLIVLPGDAVPAVAGHPEAVIVLDLDAVDTGHAAGARGLNVGGLSPSELFDAADAVRARFKLVAIALCNLAPERDLRGHTERIAAETLHRLVAP